MDLFLAALYVENSNFEQIRAVCTYICMYLGDTYAEQKGLEARKAEESKRKKMRSVASG